jgi:hypothetical protein
MLYSTLFKIIIPVTIWFLSVTRKDIENGMLISILFAIIEATHYKLFHDYWYTTIEQFCVNVVSYPIIIKWYSMYIPYYLVRIFCFPLVIWIYEFIAGHYLVWTFGKNKAWQYDETQEYVYFGGKINLNYWFRWILLACSIEVFNLLIRMIH